MEENDGSNEFKLYDSRAPIECAEFRGKSIGVFVRNLGTDYKDDPVASITRYSPCMSDIASGRNFHRDEMHEHVVNGTVHVIERIEETIAELEKHKQRLEGELERLRDNDTSTNTLG